MIEERVVLDFDPVADHDLKINVDIFADNTLLPQPRPFADLCAMPNTRMRQGAPPVKHLPWDEW